LNVPSVPPDPDHARVSGFRLELQEIRKEYPRVLACDDIHLQIRPGEIHALLGENGAGKSTLVKMIYGVTAPTRGRIFWEGQEVHIPNPARARALGIGMVFQHFSLFETLTVLENVALALPMRVAKSVLAERIRTVSEHYGLPVHPDKPVASLSVGERQRVEIVRCLLQEPRLLIMDEPTSVLAPQAVERLFTTLRQLAEEGCSILYISHKLDEIQTLCHRATVLRGGRVSATCHPGTETSQSLARMMIGRDLPTYRRSLDRAAGPVRLRIANLSLPSADPFGTPLYEVNLEVHAGEIVGLAGVSGNGQKEILQALSGEELVPRADSVQLCGVSAGRRSPAERRALGMAFVPEDRLGRGAVPDFSLIDNGMLTAARTQSLVRFGLLRMRRARAFAERCIQGFHVQCGGSQVTAKSLSGGNLQKFIVGRELLQEPQVVVCAQPTWGVDVGAATFIRQALLDLRAKGCAVLVVSEELEELFAICDRVGVLAQGRLSPLVPVADTTPESIGLWMSGLWPGESVPSHPEPAGVLEPAGSVAAPPTPTPPAVATLTTTTMANLSTQRLGARPGSPSHD
jgi:ABC-type uncharacterized transport system ATPase subunit